MNRYKYLIKNIGLLTISNFGSKILSFFLIPVYTSVLTTSEYGTYEFYLATISLLAPILTVSIANGVMRFSLDSSYQKKDIFSIGLFQEIKSIIIFSIFIYCNYIFKIIEILNLYPFLIVFLFTSYRIYNYIIIFCRSLEKFFYLSVSSSLNTVFLVLFNILFLINFKLGLIGYFYANILSYILPSIYLFLRLKLWEYVKLKKNKILKQNIISYSKPMVFSDISWWINNTSDRYIVTWLCGISVSGVYSVAYKLPSILNIIQYIFYQAWSISAIKEINNSSSKFYSNIYKIYNLGMVLFCSLIILLNKVIAGILFSNEFYYAWKYAPFLIISTIFGALIGLLEGILLATKKSFIIANTTILGALVNIVLNFILINIFGAIGAAISTMVSYILVWALRLYYSNFIVKININLKNDLCAYLLLIIQSIFLILDIKIFHYFDLQFFVFFLIVYLYKSQLIFFIKKLIVYKFSNFN